MILKTEKEYPAGRAGRRGHGPGLLGLSYTGALAGSSNPAVAADLSDGRYLGGVVLEIKAKRTVKRAMRKLNEEPVQVT